MHHSNPNRRSGSRRFLWLLILPACCLGIPLLVGILATGGVSILAGLSAASPYLIGLGVVLVAVGGWLGFRRWRWKIRARSSTKIKPLPERKRQFRRP
ncbi:MAG: hypothetical protein ACE5JP_09180 [Candidatus Bipolaricaulia bacterium]